MHVVGARNARQVALHLGIEVQIVGAVCVAHLLCVRRVGDLAAFDDAQACGHGTDRAKRHHGLGRNRHKGTRAQLQRRAGGMGLNVPAGGVHRLPDTVEFGMLAVRATRSLVGRCSRLGLGLRLYRPGHHKADYCQRRHDPDHDSSSPKASA